MFRNINRPLPGITRVIKNNTQIHLSKKNACYEVDKHTVFNTSHTQAQANVIIQGKKYIFQHNSFVRSICADSTCVYKQCDPVVERADIAFATHDGTRTDQHAYLSKTDLEAQQRPQFAKFHRNPVYSSDQQGFSRDQQHTNELNNNKEMQTNLHMNTSKKPTQYDD